MASYTISGAVTEPDNVTPWRGFYYIGIYSDTGIALDVDGSWRAGLRRVPIDPSTGAATITLPETTGGELYVVTYESFSGDKKGPWVFALTANKTWAQVIDSPAPLPIEPTWLEEALAARDAAIAAAAAADASADAAAASVVNSLAKASNLSDVADARTSRANIGGESRTMDSGNRLPVNLNKWFKARTGVVSNDQSWKSANAGIGFDVVFDTSVGRYAMMYTGYDGTTTTKFGLAYSDTLDTWSDYGSNPVFANTANPGDPDAGGVTFPQLVRDSAGLWHMFYVGFPGTGYEVGKPSICRATATSLTGTWTRQGAVLIPDNVPWIGAGASKVIYKPNVVRFGEKWYMFFNGGASIGNEGIGYATADRLAGPWTAAATAVLAPNAVGFSLVSDPEVFRVGDIYVMLFWSDSSGIFYATTTAEQFPTGWVANTTKVNGGVRPIYVEGPSGPRLFLHESNTRINMYRPQAAVGSRITGQISGDGSTVSAMSSSTYGFYIGMGTVGITLPAKAGDVIRVGIGAGWENQATDGFLDVALCDLGGTTILNYFSGNGASGNGLAGVYGPSGSYLPVGGSWQYTVQAADVSAENTIRLRPIIRVANNGTSKRITNSSSTKPHMWAENLGPGLT